MAYKKHYLLNIMCFSDLKQNYVVLGSINGICLTEINGKIELITLHFFFEKVITWKLNSWIKQK